MDAYHKILRYYDIFVPATKSEPGVNYVTLYLQRLPRYVGFPVCSLLIRKIIYYLSNMK